MFYLILTLIGLSIVKEKEGESSVISLTFFVNSIIGYFLCAFITIVERIPSGSTGVYSMIRERISSSFVSVSASIVILLIFVINSFCLVTLLLSYSI